jgi:hypothetical protein
MIRVGSQRYKKKSKIKIPAGTVLCRILITAFRLNFRINIIFWTAKIKQVTNVKLICSNCNVTTVT